MKVLFLSKRRKHSFGLIQKQLLEIMAIFKPCMFGNGQEGIVLLTPAAAWKNGRYAQTYHRFRKQEPYRT